MFLSDKYLLAVRFKCNRRIKYWCCTRYVTSSLSFGSDCLSWSFVRHQHFAISSYPVSHQTDIGEVWLVPLIAIKHYYPIRERNDLNKTGNVCMAFKTYDSPSLFLAIFIGEVTCKRWKRAEKGVALRKCLHVSIFTHHLRSSAGDIRNGSCFCRTSILVAINPLLSFFLS